MAGIASLRIVINEPEKRFAQEALDLVADYISENYSGDTDTRLQAAIRVMDDAVDGGLRSRVAASFSAKRYTRWVAIPGFRRLSYRGGVLRPSPHSSLQEDMGNVWLDNVQIERASIMSTLNYRKCTFDRCRIREISADMFETNQFYGCDFSGATFLDPDEPPRLRNLADHGNYYIQKHPPNGSQADEWTVMLKSYATRAEALQALKDFDINHFLGDL
jgi:hypothetical protein